MGSKRQGRSSNPFSGSAGNKSRLASFLQKWGGRFAPKGRSATPSPPPAISKRSFYIYLLKALPLLSLAGLLLSLLLHFEATISLPWRGESVAILDLFRTAASTGLIGFLTNWLAIKMLFYPRQRRPILGQGLIPARKDQIAIRLGEQLSGEIINSQLIVEQIEKSGLVSRYHEQFVHSLEAVVRDQEFRRDLMETAQHYIDSFVRSSHFRGSIQKILQTVQFEQAGLLEGAVLKAYKAVNRVIKGEQGTASEIQAMIHNLVLRMDLYEEQLARFLERLPDMVWRKREGIEKGVLSAVIFLLEQVNVENVITENLKNFDEARLERLFRQATSDQLDYIQYLGCLLGIIGGILIWFPYESLILMSALGGLVWGLDAMLLSRSAQRRKGANSNPN